MNFFSGGSIELLEDKYIYLDTDFLSALFNNFDFFKKVIEVFLKSYLIIDSYVEFEFLRSVFLPEQRDLKKSFINNEESFYPAANHQQVYLKVRDNALLLSKIYSHKNIQSRPSIVDLFLSGRVMLQYNSAYLATGNRKDYPSCIFDIVSVINYEENDGVIRPFCILKFNKDKFDECFDNLNSLEKKTGLVSS